MLNAQHFHQIDQLIGFIEAREEKVLLEFLMLIFYKAPNNSRGIG